MTDTKRVILPGTFYYFTKKVGSQEKVAKGLSNGSDKQKTKTVICQLEHFSQIYSFYAKSQVFRSFFLGSVAKLAKTQQKCKIFLT